VTGRVFAYRGKPLKTLNAALKRACKDADLGRDVVFHGLRHTFCT
jgi:integrase